MPPTLVNVRDHSLWGRLDETALRSASMVEAVELLWTGWRVVALVPYTAPRNGVFASVILRRTDEVAPLGWAATTINLGSGPQEAALDGWDTREELGRRLAVGWFINRAIICPKADLVGFGTHLRDVAATAVRLPEDHAEYHLPTLWQTVFGLGVEADPDADAARLLWNLQPTPLQALR